MENNIYAIPGEATQHICKERHAPSGAVLMNKENPGSYIAQANGTWKKEKDLVKKEAKDVMLAVLDGGFEYKGVVYQCREDDITQWHRGLALLDLTGDTEIEARADDNTMHLLTKAEYTELCVQAGRSYHTALTKYWSSIDMEE